MEDFKDLLEPIEILAPVSLGFEMNLCANQDVKCHIGYVGGYVCDVGQVI